MFGMSTQIHGVADYLYASRSEDILRAGLPLIQFRVHGHISDLHKLAAVMAQPRFQLIFEKDSYDPIDATPKIREKIKVYTWIPGGAVVTEPFGDDKISVRAVTFDRGLANAFAEELSKLFEIKRIEPGTFFALLKGEDGIEVRHLGVSLSPFEPGNYATAVGEDFAHVSACLKSKEPCGRLVLFDGPPGTGKTHLIRALAHDISTRFVLIPSAMVGELTGPGLMPSLLVIREEGRPIVLVIEDADAALTTRERAGTTRLAELLNLGDGLMGELADIRIVCTTNAERTALDAAVTRPGRLCRHIHVGELTAVEATECYKRLTGKETEITTPKTVAEIYRMARQDGWQSPPAKTSAGTGSYL